MAQKTNWDVLVERVNRNRVLVTVGVAVMLVLAVLPSVIPGFGSLLGLDGTVSAIQKTSYLPKKKKAGLHLIGVRLATPADRGVGDDGDGDAGPQTLSISTDFSPLGGVLEKGSSASSASYDEDGAP